MCINVLDNIIRLFLISRNNNYSVWLRHCFNCFWPWWRNSNWTYPLKWNNSNKKTKHMTENSGFQDSGHYTTRVSEPWDTGSEADLRTRSAFCLDREAGMHRGEGKPTWRRGSPRSPETGWRVWDERGASSQGNTDKSASQEKRPRGWPSPDQHLHVRLRKEPPAIIQDNSSHSSPRAQREKACLYLPAWTGS